MRLRHRALGCAATIVLLLVAGPGWAQFESLPRIGLSASATSYVDSIVTDIGEPFTVYICIFGPDEKTPLQETISSVPWVIHQVCCGAAMEILDVQYNPEMEHTGHPLSGVRSTSGTCLQRDSLLLATLLVRITADQPGQFLWASGLADAYVDCNDDHPLFQGLAVLIMADGGQVPDDQTSWGAVKSMYR